MNDTKFAKNRPAKPLENVVHGLIYLYILTIPFQALGFRFMGLAIALPELVFLALASLAIIHIMRSGQKLWIDKLDLFIFGWLASNILAGWHAGFDSIVVTEIIKTAYLIVLYMILKWTISPKMLTRIVKTLILSSLIAALTGIMGFGLGYIGIETFLAIKRPYPYLIHVIQAQGFTPSPNMLASIIMIGMLFQIQKLSMNLINSKRKDHLILLILLLGFMLTFSKTIVCLLIGITLIWYFHNKPKLSLTLQTVTKIAVAGLFIAYIFGTHFIIVEKDQDFELLKGDYIAGPVLIETDNYSIYPSQYWSLKEISLEAISQSFPWGLGPGKFNDYAHELKKNDAYPTHVPFPDPHSTYLGTIAEIGLPGFIAFFGIIFFVIKFSREILSNHTANQNMFTSLPTVFIVIGMEAISTDVMNFRHYWILLILLVSTFQNLKSTSSKSLNL
jgi:O-antigen ligase